MKNSIPVAGQVRVSNNLRSASATWWSDLLDELEKNGEAVVMFSEDIILRVALTASGFQWTQVDAD